MTSNQALTPREEKIFQLLRKHQQMSLEHIADAIGVPRNNTNTSIRFLAFKLQSTSWEITKLPGGIGRGNKAIFRMERRKPRSG